MTRNLIAILRGITINEIDDVTQALLEEGITKIEVPLNSPDAFVTIARLVKNFATNDIKGVFGAGTVTNINEVQQLADIGAQMVVSPNCNVEIIKQTKQLGMLSYPGVMTPSEAFMALQAGADGLKFFPGDVIGTGGIKAMKAVLPKGTQCWVVGGANHHNFADFIQAGATGFGIGSALYKANDDVANVRANAEMMVSAYDKAII